MQALLFLLLVDGTKIQKSRARTKVEELVVRTKIKEVSIGIKTYGQQMFLIRVQEKKVSHCNLGKCIRCKHKFVVYGGWNKNPRVMNWNQNQRISCQNQNLKSTSRNQNPRSKHRNQNPHNTRN